MGEHLFCYNIMRVFSVIEMNLTLNDKGLINYGLILFIVVLAVELMFNKIIIYMQPSFFSYYYYTCKHILCCLILKKNRQASLEREHFFQMLTIL